MFESPQKLDNSVDKNALVAIIKNLRESIDALYRRKDSVTVEAQGTALQAQISQLEAQLREAEESLERANIE